MSGTRLEPARRAKSGADGRQAAGTAVAGRETRAHAAGASGRARTTQRGPAPVTAARITDTMEAAPQNGYESVTVEYDVDNY